MQNKQTNILTNDLINNLEGYKRILTPEIIEYLYSLINLEISVLKENIISTSQISLLSELKLYRQIVIHNIYNRTLNIFPKYASVFHIEQYPHVISIFSKDNLEKKHELFNYSIHENGISSIFIKQTIIDSIKRQEQIDRLYEELEKIKSAEETPPAITNKLFGANKEIRMNYIAEIIRELEQRASIEVNIASIIGLENDFLSQILGSEGLDVSKDFIEKTSFSTTYFAKKSMNHNPYYSEVEKTLTKKLSKDYPHTKILKTINFY